MIFCFLLLFLNSLVESRPQGWPFLFEPSIPTNISSVDNQLFTSQIPDSIIRDYSPLVYLHNEEIFFPSDVEHFLDNVNIESDHMSTIETLECESCSNLTFFSGFNPAENLQRTPVYAIVVNKDPNIVDVFYFYFYPFNLGKRVCVGIKVNNICLGYYSYFGNHVGDWEHVSVRFENGRPQKIYYSSHNFGVLVPWTSATAHSEFPTHPIAYCSDGSHGCYPTKGDYVYNQIANGESLIDRSNDGILWKTWQNVVILRVNEQDKCCYDFNGQYLSDVIIKNGFNWIDFDGRWGNKQGLTCLFGQCVLEGGPSGPFKKGFIFSQDLN